MELIFLFIKISLEMPSLENNTIIIKIKKYG
jgi:hypothetical protein